MLYLYITIKSTTKIHFTDTHTLCSMQDTLRFIPSAQDTSIYLEKNSDFLFHRTSYRNQAFSFYSFSELFPQAENARGRGTGRRHSQTFCNGFQIIRMEVYVFLLLVGLGGLCPNSVMSRISTERWLNEITSALCGVPRVQRRKDTLWTGELFSLLNRYFLVPLLFVLFLQVYYIKLPKEINPTTKWTRLKHS